jgi:hypothetical protein
MGMKMTHRVPKVQYPTGLTHQGMVSCRNTAVRSCLCFAVSLHVKDDELGTDSIMDFMPLAKQ